MNRYKQARERAGLSVAQAERVTGLAVGAIEGGARGLDADEDAHVHALLAQTYGVTECWLAGHDAAPDLTDLARQAEKTGVSIEDWQEIAVFVQSMAVCAQCAEGKA